mgnify:CR=1 FL=1
MRSNDEELNNYEYIWREQVKEKNYEAIIEGILFTMGKSVEGSQLAVALEITNEEVYEIVHNMMKHYDKKERGIKIIELEDSFQLCTKPELYDYLIRIAKQPKRHVLTDVVLETLSIIAYKQPVTKIEIEKIRGVSCEHAVNKLVEYNLVCELGRLDAPGRPLLFGTTEEFLRSFGVHSVEELPVLNQDQLEEFKQQAEEENQNVSHFRISSLRSRMSSDSSICWAFSKPIRATVSAKRSPATPCSLNSRMHFSTRERTFFSSFRITSRG